MEENIHKVSFSAILIKTERITGRSGSPSAFIISETSEQVSIKFCIATLHWKLQERFRFWFVSVGLKPDIELKRFPG